MKTRSTALALFLAATTVPDAVAFRPPAAASPSRGMVQLRAVDDDETGAAGLSRRDLFATAASGTVSAAALGALSGLPVLSSSPEPANAIGPIKINLLNPKYSAIPCPKDKPIPGEKAMKGMQGLCVTVDVDLEDVPDRELEKIGVYGYITDKGTGESVLANNPDLSTDAGQFAMIEKITKTDKKTQFEFIAAVPREVDLTPFEEGIAPLNFKSLRVVSFPGGQQYGSINPCEMNEFSDECDAWEAENGPYEKKDYMVKSNERTKGR
mmetsp:Transcript_10548/g.25408  ORF Transcript_10548/g.25408 Transcript_10548/m.25408 type:complete len:267 (+) Transcript_10548:147-947(+)|eukprot:CAMPEP_0197184184 /NCGR_PEP_ID=MMETSP1423-20130617/9407_1 /TAXON_ID=476441 /ORGANISM="Pseudo-nitzschia heimii, Strain UNC1101" /LENGTH=266 /DNA_ID=CAMNT_0042634949 /DNA_START=149 /DNA_END=949 /DNA_ORIENTATION=+